MARKNFTLDDSGLTIKAAGLVGASAGGSVIADLGEGFVEGNILIDVTALEVDTGDESYDIILQLSPDSDFGTDTNIVEKVGINLADATQKRSDANADDVVGRYVIPFNNLYGTSYYRYARIYTVVGGTVVTGINYSARIVKR